MQTSKQCIPWLFSTVRTYVFDFINKYFVANWEPKEFHPEETHPVFMVSVTEPSSSYTKKPEQEKEGFLGFAHFAQVCIPVLLFHC